MWTRIHLIFPNRVNVIWPHLVVITLLNSPWKQQIQTGVYVEGESFVRFYWLWLWLKDILHLTVLLPSYPGEPYLIGIPIQNLMGWISSAQFFSAYTKTVSDLANADLANKVVISVKQRTLHQFDVVL